MQRPVCYQDLKTSAQNYVHRVWQETWDQQVLNKLHSIHPSTSHWAALPVRRHDVRLTRLRIGHTRFTHRHLLLGAIFQQDNARPHTARVAQDFLRHLQTLPWPARSPDLSPIEHVWDQLKRQMPSCHSVHDLESAVQVLCAHLPQDNIRCLINSIPDRVAACIAAGGGPTRY
ncbi:transposable element Tcb2 transposase [Trichonephila clavipes]|nr:transposable element Tcb2 transposase [Trichonephila clavipes]